jgi:hypothetical protein
MENSTTVNRVQQPAATNELAQHMGSPRRGVLEKENMRNCLILGSGRSGTSMMAGILHQAGYYMGDNLYPPRHGNPKGSFENAMINGINEGILKKYEKKSLLYLLRKRLGQVKTTVYRPGTGQRWLRSLPVNTAVTYIDKKIEKKIKKATAKTPFAYKDPRFCYTLPVWAKYLEPGTLFTCIFREPDVTVESMLTECRSVDYLKNLEIDGEKAYEVWINMYSHILEKHLNAFHHLVFIFVHYRQVYNGTALGRLSEALGVLLNNDFVDKKLKRTQPTPGEAIPQKARQIYSQLCHLAGYDN